jgi:ferric-dicitrate binding protein FerR (iron transport regulator)
VNNQYYNELFGRLLEGRLSPEETDQLLNWLNREENAGEAARIISSRLSQQVKEEEITPDIRHALQARLPLVLNAGKRHARVSIFRQNWFTYAAAAVLIIAVGMALWTVPNKPAPVATPVKQLAIKTDIAAGKQGAILTLADGRQVVLDSLSNGIVAEQKGVKVLLEDGKLKYDELPIADSRLTTYNAISTPKGRQFQLVLPDGTKVWLNAASSLKYPTHFSGNERRVTITGEAYFEVAKNVNMPFIATIPPQPGGLGGASVKVLGTHFNINAYSNEPSLKTTLLEGSVQVQQSAIGDQEASTVLLKPGEQAIGGNHSKFTIDHSPNIDKVMAWKNGVFNFNEATLQEVMHQLERWYDIDVQYEPGVPKLEFVGKMGRDLSLNNVLRGLELSKVHFRLEGRKLTVMP